MLLYWPVQQSLGCCGPGGGFAYQWLEYFSRFFSHSIGNRSMAGHNRPEGGFWSVDLGEPIQLGGTTTCGVHGFISGTV